jgi:hypothetical protein
MLLRMFEIWTSDVDFNSLASGKNTRDEVENFFSPIAIYLANIQTCQKVSI